MYCVILDDFNKAKIKDAIFSNDVLQSDSLVIKLNSAPDKDYINALEYLEKLEFGDCTFELNSIIFCVFRNCIKRDNSSESRYS